MSQFETSSISMINRKKKKETVDRETAHKRSGRLLQMLRSTAAASVLRVSRPATHTDFISIY